MLNVNQKAVVEHIEETAPGLPVQKRIRIYRGLADLLSVKRHRDRLIKKVKILEQAEARCAELHFEDGLKPHNGKDGHQ